VNNYFLRKIFLALTFLGLAIISEMFMYMWLGWELIPKYFWLDTAVLLFITFAVFLCKSHKTMVIWFSIILGVEWVLVYTNICIYHSLNDVFSLQMVNLAGETAKVLTFDLFPIPPLFIIAGIVAIWVILAKLFSTKLEYSSHEETVAYRYLLRNFIIIALCASFVLMGVARSGIDSHSDYYLLDDKYLYESFGSPKDALRKFGLFTFYTQQFTRVIYNPYRDNLFTIDDVDNYLSNKTYENTNSKLFNVCDGQNVIMIMGESFEWYAISKELTPTLYALANGYDFSGGLDFYDVSYDEKGNARLVFDAARYDESKQGRFGMTLTGYYSAPSTDYAEMTGMLGNYPYGENFTRGASNGGDLFTNVNYSFTLPNMLKDNDKVEVAQYFHNYTSVFYRRNRIIPMFGFDNVQFIDDLVDVRTDPNLVLSHCVLDSEMVAKYKEKMCPTDKQFFTYFTTVTTHGEYDTINPLLEEHYKYLDENVDYYLKETNPSPKSLSGKVRTYLASCLDTEWMMTILLDYLIDTGLYDNTMIVFYADHQSYYHALDVEYKPIVYASDGFVLHEGGEKIVNEWAKRNGNLDYNISSKNNNPTRYNLPCFYYSTKINNDMVAGREQYVDKFTCSFDHAPTIMTLLGVDYEENLYMGYPVLCVSNVGNEIGVSVYISRNGIVFDKHMCIYDGIEHIYKDSSAKKVDERPFLVATQKEMYKHIMITMMYTHNLFK